jgi:hypothetical protein
MPVYHGIKTILIRVPKTASTSMCSGLHYANSIAGGSVVTNLKHEGIVEIRDQTSKHYFGSYYKAAFVRNPWDWLVSYFSYDKALLKQINGNNPQGNRRETINGVRAETTFEEYIMLVKDMNEKLTKPGPSVKQTLHPYQPQYKYLVDENEEIIIDFIGKYEDIENDWSNLTQKIKADNSILSFQMPLGKTNVSNHEHYKEYYTDELREIVGSIYKKDIELFDYKF